MFSKQSVKEPHVVKPAAAARERKVKVRRTGPSPIVLQIGRFLKSIFHVGSVAHSGVSSVTGKVYSHAFPNRTEPLVSLSPASMLFIAICVPLAVVAVATMVYLNAGRSEQFNTLLFNADQVAQRALEQSDPQLQRDNWTQVLLWLDQAEEYQHTDKSAALREQAQNALDSMDGIVRLSYQSVLPGGFAGEVSITRMVATLNDVYMLELRPGPHPALVPHCDRL